MSEQKDEKIENSKDLRIIAAIGYLWILCLLPLLTKRNSEFAQHHGKQGLVLTIASFAIWLVAWFPIVGWLIGFFGSLILVVLAVVGIMNALQGKYWEMPILGEYAKKIKM
ncbi:MAG: DUF4870 domain-containing protein [bacterium]|nr:DUF4870 domain-containing protein [bacterium]